MHPYTTLYNHIHVRCPLSNIIHVWSYSLLVHRRTVGMSLLCPAVLCPQNLAERRWSVEVEAVVWFDEPHLNAP